MNASFWAGAISCSVVRFSRNTLNSAPMSSSWRADDASVLAARINRTRNPMRFRAFDAASTIGGQPDQSSVSPTRTARCGSSAAWAASSRKRCMTIGGTKTLLSITDSRTSPFSASTEFVLSPRRSSSRTNGRIRFRRTSGIEVFRSIRVSESYMNVKTYHYFTGILRKSDTFSVENGIYDVIG